MVTMTLEAYDVVVLGGGAAGLNGALTLARARRSVLVVDGGEPRNAPAAHMHAFLSRDGMPPGELLKIGREEVRGYGGEIVSAQVNSVARKDGGFAVTLDDGRVIRARRLLVATGVVDELPDVPGLRERWGRDVLQCPYCHGWEVRDQAVAVLATGAHAAQQALLYRQWTPNVTLLRHTGPEPTATELTQLAARGVRLVDGQVAGLEVADDRLTGVRLADGTVLACEALVVSARAVPRVGMLEPLGLTVTEHPMGAYVAADQSGLTEVPGVWVAGNVTDLSAQVIHAAAGGSRAAAFINFDLVTEDTARAVAAAQPR
ncbi:NAD(P)/FAD-dependent oxidoreductase [Catellatospora methionotrophica]